MSIKDYIQKHKWAAIVSTLQIPLFPSVKMAQAILESGRGASDLAARYNNHFGIKAGSDWKGTMVNIETDEYINGDYISDKEYLFRVYAWPFNSFKDHSKLIKKRFPSVLLKTTPEYQAIELQNKGYATDPEYANKLINIINSNNLKELDKNKIQMKNIEIAITILILVAMGLKLYSFTK